LPAAADVPSIKQKAPEAAPPAEEKGKGGKGEKADKGDRGRQEVTPVALRERARTPAPFFIHAFPETIAGLEPGRKHERDRHNVGFWFVSRLAAAQRIELKSVAKYHGCWASSRSPRATCARASADLHEPLGEIVGSLSRFYKIQPEEVLVVHDELDFSAGTAKLKLGGGVAGHNGLKTSPPSSARTGSGGCGSASAIRGTRTSSPITC